MQTTLQTIPLALAGAAAQPGRATLYRLAQELESVFLAEMLGHAGADAAPAGFSGGIGEEQFGSFLRNEQANAMAEAGGVGLAESLFRAMTRGQHDAE